MYLFSSPDKSVHMPSCLSDYYIRLPNFLFENKLIITSYSDHIFRENNVVLQCCYIQANK